YVLRPSPSPRRGEGRGEGVRKFQKKSATSEPPHPILLPSGEKGTRRLFRCFGRLTAPFDGLAPHIIGEPHRIGAERAPAVGGDARAGAPRRQTKHVH